MKIAFLPGTLSAAAGGMSTCVPPMINWFDRNPETEAQVFGARDPDAPFAAKQWGADVHAFQTCGPRSFEYTPGLAAALQTVRPNILSLHGLWRYPSLVSLRHYRRYGTPYVVTPHGMLDTWALQRSRWKKGLVGHWFEYTHIAQAACLHATSEMEAQQARSYGYRGAIAVVPNGIDIPEMTARAPDHSAPRRLLFLSRLHPKKGLPVLLTAWSKIAPQRPDWELVIAGPDEIGHKSEMQTLAQNLSLPRVTWVDAVHGDHKDALFRSADLFVLPTHSENFGMVVAEALSYGLPVITTQNAPWSDLVPNKCGWWIPLQDKALVTATLDATALPQAVLSAMGERGRTWMIRDFCNDHVAEKMFALFQWVLGQDDRPTFVYDD